MKNLCLNLQKKIYWEKILSLAKEFDNTGLEDYINEFVDLSYCEDTKLLSKGEFFMLVNQKAFVDAFSLSQKILKLNHCYLESKKYNKTNEQCDLYGFGTYFSMKENEQGNFYIGLNPSISDSKYFFTLDIYKTQQINADISKMKHLEDEEWIYFSFEDDENYQIFCITEDESEQQELYNKMIDNILYKLNLL